MDGAQASMQINALDIGGGATLATKSAAEVSENWVHLKFTHAGQEYSVELADSDRYALRNGCLFGTTAYSWVTQGI